MNITIAGSTEIMNDGLCRVTVRYRDGHGWCTKTTLWSKGKQRKEKECFRCGGELSIGDYTFRPITNAIYRSARLCVECVAGF